jgi:hypothetical protein
VCSVGGPFYVICPGSTDVEEFKQSYQVRGAPLVMSLSH